MKKKLLILSPIQFGYFTDTLKYCQYAADEFDITYLSWDYGKPMVEMPGIKVKYISRRSNIITRNIRLLKAYLSEIRQGHDVIFAHYIKGVSLVKLLSPNRNFIIDIRTLSVHPGKFYRSIYNSVLRLELLFFKKISIISDGIARKLRVKNYYLLPLGGECFTSRPKSFETLSLLYVGTLLNRNMIECVKGFHQFVEVYPQAPVSTFTIVGNSPGPELEEIRAYIAAHNLGERIITTGEIPQNQLHQFFEAANIGISYIPMRSYFQYQPPTKTFEYLVSGLPVIATSTYENQKVVNEDTGVLIEDNAQSFFQGVLAITGKNNIFAANALKSDYAGFLWKNIVADKFVPFIKGS
ncbi:MAG TPA: glycosyltransferase [Mucilaginibacter sp.]|jgi:glycosyltransferase involved in cell wall biosynthesis|nr:glycosyltransferase [Mucilaginibacter sp.]